MQTAQFNVPDIECEGCANAIKKSLSNVTGISSIIVQVASKQVTVEHSASLPIDVVANALVKAGFNPTCE